MLDAFPSSRSIASATLAKALLAQGRGREALEASGSAMAFLEESGRIEGDEALVRLVHAEALHDTGDRKAARQAIAAARIRLLGRADRITDPTFRDRFLEDVPDNARTLSLAAAGEGGGAP